MCLAFPLCVYLLADIQVFAVSCYWEHRCRTQEYRRVCELLASSLDTYQEWNCWVTRWVVLCLVV